jgi:N-acetylmuramoyl-L-alanine amidase
VGNSVGEGDYVVKQGDCISSIAQSRGHFWETIWYDEANANLRRVRGNPNVLLPGDRLTIPPLRENQESAATEQRHRFRLLGVPAELKLRILEDGEPVADTDWHLDVDGQTFTGTTDGDGQLTVSIAGDAREGKLRVGETIFQLELGSMDPLSEISGIQRRLNNLHFDCKVTGELDEQTLKALNLFREAAGLKLSDQVDDETRTALEEWHDDMQSLPEDKADEDAAETEDDTDLEAASDAPPDDEDELEDLSEDGIPSSP